MGLTVDNGGRERFGKGGMDEEGWGWSWGLGDELGAGVLGCWGLIIVVGCWGVIAVLGHWAICFLGGRDCAAMLRSWAREFCHAGLCWAGGC